jgi:hypothetical protein
MRKAGNGVSRWRAAAGAAALLVLCASGCATRRVVRVVDGNGTPVPEALVVFQERNIAWPIRCGAGFANSAGEYAFKARGFAEAEAFGPSSGWGRTSLARNYPTRTVALAAAPEAYAGSLAEGYLARTEDVPEDIRRRVEAFFRWKAEGEAGEGAR